MNVLSLVTTEGSSHYQEQIRILEELGVDHDIIATSPIERGEQRLSFNLAPEWMRNPISLTGKATKFYPRVLAASLTEEYDLVHAVSGKIAPAAILQPTRPVVLSLWGSDLLGNVDGGISSFACKWSAKRADATIVMSEEMHEVLDIEPHIIPHGIDLTKFKPMSQSECREIIGWGSDSNIVLFPYSPDRTVKRFELANDVVDKVNKGIDDDVTMKTVTGKPHSDIPYYMNASDALLLTSTHEGSPNTVKEAMACNLPVVATDVGDVAERLSGVTHSYVCPSEDELVERLTEVLRAGERSNGREYVQELSLDRMGERIVEAYEEVLSDY